jgi:hypothetical protein
VSIGELWPDIDKLDEINSGGASVKSIPGNVPHNQSSLPSVVRTNENVRLAAKRVMVDDVPGPSTAPPRGRGRGSAKNKATWILSAAPELFHLTCGGHVLIGDIHLRLVWIEANGRLF